jgi:uroporphyrinogen-III decarboxylase
MNKPVYTHQKIVADYVKARIARGATITSIVESSTAKFSNAPSNYRTFVRLYGKDIAEAKAAIEDDIGSMVISRAKESDKILELLARSRGNFNPVDKHAIAEVDGDDLEDDSAVKSLMRLLGKDVEDDEE